MKFKSLSILFFVLGMAAYANAQLAELTMFTGNTDSEFGSCVDVQGDYIFAGSPFYNSEAGLLTIIKKEGLSWIETEIAPADNQAGDRFGGRVAVDGDWLIVGSSFNSDQGNNAGAVYFYHFDGTDWVYHSKVYGDDIDEEDYFGCAVDIDGTTAVVGAYYQGGASGGAAYAFEFDGTDWVQTDKLMPADQSDMGSYGMAVAVSGDNAIVGNPSGLSSEGTAYIFSHDGTSWQEAQMIQAPTKAWAFFGEAVAIENDFILVGQFFKNNGTGAAYGFRYNGTSWELEHSFTTDGLENDDAYGGEVTIHGDTVAISAGGLRTTDGTEVREGAVFTYEYDGTSWGNEQKYIGSNTDINSNFGREIALEDGVLIVSSSVDDNVYYFTGEVATLDVYHVSPEGSGNFSGDSWQNAYPGAVDNDANDKADLQDLIDNVPDGTEIWLKAGTYKPTTGTDRTIYFSLKKNVTIYGGFAGTETSIEERDWQANKTIFSGDIDNNDNLNADGICESYTDISGNNSYSLMMNTHVDRTAIIDGVYFTGGLANGEGDFSYLTMVGSAVRNFGASFTNSFDHDHYASPTMRNCAFIGNKSTAGASVFNRGAYVDSEETGYIGITEPLFENCIIKNNYGSMEITSDPYGYASVEIRNTKFIGNECTGAFGGALEISQINGHDNVTGIIENCEFRGNISPDKGGAVFADGTQIEFKNCLFSGNSAPYGGVAYFAGDIDWCVPVFMNCTFAANTSTGSSENSASVISNFSADVSLVNCNIYGNSEKAITTMNYLTYGETFFKNCNIQGSGGSSAWSFDEFDIDLGGNMDVDPLFTDLPDFSTAPTTEGDFRLETGTPLANAGMTGTYSYSYGAGTVTSEVPTTDLDGETRIDEPEPGAYEYLGPINIFEKEAAKAEIFPNPTTGIISLNLSEASDIDEIILTDITGKTLGTFQNTADRMIIDLSAQPAGIYFVKFINENQEYSEKVIKK